MFMEYVSVAPWARTGDEGIDFSDNVVRRGSENV
jgi:hypothetical protein